MRPDLKKQEGNSEWLILRRSRPWSTQGEFSPEVKSTEKKKKNEEIAWASLPSEKRAISFSWKREKTKTTFLPNHEFNLAIQETKMRPSAFSSPSNFIFSFFFLRWVFAWRPRESQPVKNTALSRRERRGENFHWRQKKDSMAAMMCLQKSPAGLFFFAAVVAAQISSGEFRQQILHM